LKAVKRLKDRSTALDPKKRLSGALSAYYSLNVGDSLRVAYKVETNVVTVLGCGQRENF